MTWTFIIINIINDMDNHQHQDHDQRLVGGCWTGCVDIYGHSHQIWHVLIFSGNTLDHDLSVWSLTNKRFCNHENLFFSNGFLALPGSLGVSRKSHLLSGHWSHQSQWSSCKWPGWIMAGISCLCLWQCVHQKHSTTNVQLLIFQMNVADFQDSLLSPTP